MINLLFYLLDFYIMKKLILFLCLFCFCTIYAQESVKILYSEGPCIKSRGVDLVEDEEASFEDDIQSLSFKLENGSLFITGKIIANCCGSHHLEYEIYADSIFLSRVDEGELCRCMCLYDINIEIKDCPADSYKIKLLETGHDEGIETIVHSKTGLNAFIENDIKCYPNPANKYIMIELSHHKFERIALYDGSGKVVNEIKNVENNILRMNTDSFISGSYFLKLFKADGTSITKKIILL